ncbi:50S ribosomal protein L10 [Patescibacteria group bacterium]|nr:50S ribosomal protein L10 [Patescibacteria group bacterium]
MPKNKIQKQEIFRDLNERIKKSKSVVFAGFNALGVKDNEVLRSKLREENSEYYVAKKTLLDLALKENKIEVDIKALEGKVATIFSYEDEVASAKILGNFLKDKEKAEKIVFLGGVLDGKFLTKNEVEALAKLPSKHELYAKLVGSLNAPISGFVNVMAGNLRGLVTVLKAVAEKK